MDGEGANAETSKERLKELIDALPDELAEEFEHLLVSLLAAGSDDWLQVAASSLASWVSGELRVHGEAGKDRGG